MATSRASISAAIKYACYAALLACAIGCTKFSREKPVPDLSTVEFQQLDQGLWLSRIEFDFPPFGVFPLSVFLLNEGSNWILVDAGIPDEIAQGYVAAFLNAIDSLLAKHGGSLKLILLTHGHIDHIGTLPQLQNAYPEATVVLHAHEFPFMVNGTSYGALPTDSILYEMAWWWWGPSGLTVPVSSLTALHGEEGDIADLAVNVSKGAWLPSPGLLKWWRMPGHVPGNVVFLHRPSQSLIAADALEVEKSGFWKTGPPEICLPLRAASNNYTEARESIRKLAALEFKTAYPCHDVNYQGLSRRDVAAFADTL